MDILSEMEIEFELEDSDLVFTFEPWERNHSSREVQWQLPNGSHSRVVANLLDDVPVQTARDRSIYPLGDL